MSKKQKKEMAAGAEITIQFGGKDVKVRVVQQGVVQKSESIFYIQDSKTKAWLYCSPERLEKVLKKWNNDLSHYQGRASKAEDRKAALAAKKAEAPKTEAPAEETEPAAEEATPEPAHAEMAPM